MLRQLEQICYICNSTSDNIRYVFDRQPAHHSIHAVTNGINLHGIPIGNCEHVRAHLNNHLAKISVTNWEQDLLLQNFDTFELSDFAST